MRSLLNAETQKKAAGASSFITVNLERGISTAEVSMGGAIEVRLKSNPSTGYSWTAKFDDTTLRETSSELEMPDSGGRVGAGGTQVFTFTALVAGQHTLDFMYCRGRATPDAKPDATLNVAVSDPQAAERIPKPATVVR